MILSLLVAFLAYRKAKDNLRSRPILWAIGGFLIFVGVQVLVSAIAGVTLALYVGFNEQNERDFNTLSRQFEIPVTILAIVCSLISSWVYIKYLDKPFDDTDEFHTPPPPPPTTF